MVPSSVRQRVYWAAPGSVRRSRSLERVCWRVSWAPSPRTSTLPRWERSNTPAPLAHRLVLGHGALVLDGHVPAGEGAHLGAERQWTRVGGERRSSVRPAVIVAPPRGRGVRPVAGGPGGGAAGRHQHPVRAAGLEAGVVGPHPLRVADDLHVGGQAAGAAWPPGGSPGGADPAAVHSPSAASATAVVSVTMSRARRRTRPDPVRANSRRASRSSEVASRSMEATLRPGCGGCGGCRGSSTAFAGAGVDRVDDRQDLSGHVQVRQLGRLGHLAHAPADHVADETMPTIWSPRSPAGGAPGLGHLAGRVLDRGVGGDGVEVADQGLVGGRSWGPRRPR